MLTEIENQQSAKEVKSWPDLAIGLYDKLTGRGAEIIYDFRNMEIQVPDKVGAAAEHTVWKVSGVLIIRTRDTKAEEHTGAK